MNIWKVDFDVEKYMWFIFKETKDMGLLDFGELFYDKEMFPQNLPENIVFYMRNVNKRSRYKLLGDVMMSSGPNSGIISDRAKKLLEAKYMDLFQFFPVSLEEFPKEKYYILYPPEFVAAEEVLDMDNTVIYYMLSDGETVIDYLRNYRETVIIYKILRYAFTPEIKGHHFFRIAFNHGKIKKRVPHYCDDEFKNFVKENNITGLIFEKIFEF